MPAAGQDRPDRDYERPFELFVSYAHASEPIKDRLLVHLAPLKRSGLVSGTSWPGIRGATISSRP